MTEEEFRDRISELERESDNKEHEIIQYLERREDLVLSPSFVGSRDLSPA